MFVWWWATSLTSLSTLSTLTCRKILCTQNTGREENRSYNGKMAMDGFIAWMGGGTVGGIRGSIYFRMQKVAMIRATFYTTFHECAKACINVSKLLKLVIYPRLVS